MTPRKLPSLSSLLAQARQWRQSLLARSWIQPWRGVQTIQPLPTALQRPLLHELLLGGMGAITMGRLLRKGRRRLAFGVYGAVLLPYIAVVGRGCLLARRPATEGWQRLRLAYPFLLMNVVFQATERTVEALEAPALDHLLIAIDRRLLGGDLGRWLERRHGWLYAPAISELFSLAYLLFFPYLVGSIARAAREPLPRQIAFATGLWSLYAFGLLGYTLVPARGPFSAFAGSYQREIRGWFWTPLNQRIVTAGTGVFDVFPSLHVGVAGYLLLWDWRMAPGWARVALPPFVLLCLSTIYLRYHYLVDLLAGALLAAGAAQLAWRNAQHLAATDHGNFAAQKMDSLPAPAMIC